MNVARTMDWATATLTALLLAGGMTIVATSAAQAQDADVHAHHHEGMTMDAAVTVPGDSLYQLPITLNTSASPNDKTYAQQLKGAAILEPIWQRQPTHPGVAHYLIHLHDYPALAAAG